MPELKSCAGFEPGTLDLVESALTTEVLFYGNCQFERPGRRCLIIDQLQF